jgi:hypothetical protein
MIALCVPLGSLFSFGPGIAFLDTGGLAAQITKIIQLGPADLATANDVDMIDHRTVKGKDPFHADAKANLADRYGLASTAMLPGDANTLERLKPFLIAFLDPNMDPKRVSGLEAGNIFLQLRIFYNV